MSDYSGLYTDCLYNRRILKGIVLKAIYLLKYRDSKDLHFYDSCYTPSMNVPILTDIEPYHTYNPYFYSKFNIANIKLLDGYKGNKGNYMRIEFGKEKTDILFVNCSEQCPLGVKLLNAFIERYEKETEKKIKERFENE